MRKLLNEKWIKPSRIDEHGNMFWYNKYGEYHSNRDNPAVIFPSGYKSWFKNGKRHRDGDKPAIIYLNGEKWWYKNGKLIKKEKT